MLVAARFVFALLLPPQDSLPPLPVSALDSLPAPGESAAPTLTSLAPTIENVLGLGPRVGLEIVAIPPDTSRRPRAIEYSDLYATRLAIHRYASYATIPLFAAQYFVGRKLIHQGTAASSSLRGAHGALAGTMAVLFGVNTVTGLWNLWDSRKDPNGRTRRTVHSLMMIAADAGFVATGATAPDDDAVSQGGSSASSTHQALAISSMGLALASYVMMLVWKD